MKAFRMLLKMSVTRLTTFSGVIWLIYGCSVTPQIQYMKKTEPVLADATKSTQSDQGISISVKPLISTDYDNPDYKQKVKVSWIPFLEDQPKTEEKEFQFKVFEGLTALDVTIVNNTDHILRMKDSRVAFIDPDSDEPVLAFDKESFVEGITELKGYQEAVKMINSEFKKTEDTEDKVQKAFSNIAKKIKFINGFNKEIMPGMKTTGIVIFPIDLEKAGEGKISFIDMAAQTDAAGNVTKKTRFDFVILSKEKFFKRNPAIDKDWVETTSEEFMVGTTKK